MKVDRLLNDRCCAKIHGSISIPVVHRRGEYDNRDILARVSFQHIVPREQGHVSDATDKLMILSDRDRRYFAKALQDGDFAAFGANLQPLFRRAIASPGPLARAAQAKIAEVTDAIAWSKRSAPTSNEDLTAIQSMEKELANAKEALPTLDVDIETLNERLSEMGADLDGIAKRGFQGNIAGSQKAIADCESRKNGCEHAIERLKATMKQTSGAGFGWLFFGVAFVISFWLPGSAFGPWMVVTVIGIVASVMIARSIKNQPHKNEIEARTYTIDECCRLLPELRQRMEAWQAEMRSFEAWGTRQPPHSSSETVREKPNQQSV